MSTLETLAPSIQAVKAVLAELADAGIPATRDPGAFFPQPVGVLVGLPTLIRRTQNGRVYTIQVLIVSGDPFNALGAVDRALALADDVALALRADNYRPSSWRSSGRAEPLPALELTVTATAKEASP